MNYFITSETTFDVTHTELLVLLDFEEVLNRTEAGLRMAGIERVGIVLVVMNPDVATPFPPGVVLRRARKELDIKPSVRFTDWKMADRVGRIGLVVKAIAGLSQVLSERISDQDMTGLLEALTRGWEGLQN